MMDTTSDLIQRLWFLDILSSIDPLCAAVTTVAGVVTVFITVFLVVEISAYHTSTSNKISKWWFLLLFCTATVTFLGAVGCVVTPSMSTINLQRQATMEKLRKENLIPEMVETKEDVR